MASEGSSLSIFIVAAKDKQILPKSVIYMTTIMKQPNARMKWIKYTEVLPRQTKANSPKDLYSIGQYICMLTRILSCFLCSGIVPLL